MLPMVHVPKNTHRPFRTESLYHHLFRWLKRPGYTTEPLTGHKGTEKWCQKWSNGGNGGNGVSKQRCPGFNPSQGRSIHPLNDQIELIAWRNPI